MNMDTVDLDQDFLTRFSCMGTQDRDVLATELQSILKISRHDCMFFLEMTNWNLQAAVGAYCDFCGQGVSLPQVRLVDETPMCLIPANTRFTKTWRLRNTGHDWWPNGVRLSLQSGCLFSGPSLHTLPSLKPGEERAVSMELQSPSIAGRYQAQWRMCTNDGALCGESLWIIVEVQEDSMVTGLAEQLSGISTSDREFMERAEAHLNTFQPPTPHSSPIQPCTPHPSPSSMQGDLYQTDSELPSLRTDPDRYFGNT